MEREGSVMVEFGSPYVPEAGERDVYIDDVYVREAKYGRVVLLDLVELGEAHKGEVFTVLYGLPGKVSEQSRLGQLLAQMGFPVRDWVSKGLTVDLTKLLRGKRMRIVTGLSVKEGQRGTFIVANIAAVKHVYGEGEGPEVPSDETPF